jgi:hypothetical protein
MSIQDLKRLGNHFQSQDTSASVAREGMKLILESEKRMNALVSRRYREKISQHTEQQLQMSFSKIQRELREEATEVREAVRSALRNAIEYVERDLVICLAKRKIARHPLRDIEGLPATFYPGRRQDEPGRRRALAQEGERTTLRAKRLAHQSRRSSSWNCAEIS